MSDQPNGSKQPKESKTWRDRVTRRKFIGAMGAGAAAAAYLQRGAPAHAQSAQDYYYQDSFGNVVPAGQGAIQLGIYPPPIGQPAGAPLAPGVPDLCPTGSANTTYYTCNFPQFHILLIMVDQMRNPAFWLPSGNNWISSYNNATKPILPNLAGLAQKSFSFPNYFVAATVCGPSRACLLSGLYTQQTCIFKSGSAGSGAVPVTPPLLPYNSTWNGNNNASIGFPTIGNVLSQPILIGNSTTNNASYDCAWIGKWHLSCDTGHVNGQPGSHGPADYGFGNQFCIPNANSGYPAGSNGYPSPNGAENEGSGGDFLDSTSTASRDVVNFLGTSPFPANSSSLPTIQLNDAAIADAFTNYWLPDANSKHNDATVTPWFCAVSFINPHDIGDFPYSYGLTGGNNTYFNNSSNPSGTFYSAPPLVSSNNVYYGNSCGNNNACSLIGSQTTIRTFLPNNSSGAYANLPPGAGNTAPWNYENPIGMPYSNANNSAKPGMQAFFQNNREQVCGKIASPAPYTPANNSWGNPAPWQTFLNYYMWMQSCVDYQIGQVLGTNPSSNNYQRGLAQYPSMDSQTVIIFTSDHGDYGGSHGLHAKGGGLYEEVLNVPLFVSYPTMRSNATLAGPISLPYVCSSVDILPFLYTLALGNHSWRTNPNDMIFYLHTRESINDAIAQYANNSANTNFLQQRRISSIPLYNNCTGGACQAWQLYQPFVLHTADDFSAVSAPTQGQAPSHAIAFRTVDITDPNNNSAPFFGQEIYGGGKLGLYSYWDTCDATGAPIVGLNNANATPQYEFYNYSLHPAVGSLVSNPQEVGNQYFDAGGNTTPQAAAYQSAFFNNSAPGISVQGELYTLNNVSTSNNTVQVAAAIQVAFENYIAFLNAAGFLTGNNNDGFVGSCSGCTNCNSNKTQPIYKP